VDGIRTLACTQCMKTLVKTRVHKTRTTPAVVKV
jgi:hypothetical protein